LVVDKHTQFLLTLGALVIQHEHLFQLISPDSANQSLKELGAQVAEQFYANHFQQWTAKVKEHSWWQKTREQTVTTLTDLVITHRMPVLPQ